MNCNADCVLIEPQTLAASTDALQRTHHDRRDDAQRCWLMQKATRVVPTEAGLATITTWSCRLATKQRVRAGWRVEAKPDGEDDWEAFSVIEATGSPLQRGVLHLTMERVAA